MLRHRIYGISIGLGSLLLPLIATTSVWGLQFLVALQNRGFIDVVKPQFGYTGSEA